MNRQCLISYIYIFKCSYTKQEIIMLESLAAEKLKCTALCRMTNSTFCSVYSCLVCENFQSSNSTRTVRHSNLCLFCFLIYSGTFHQLTCTSNGIIADAPSFEVNIAVDRESEENHEAYIYIFFTPSSLSPPEYV